MRIYFVKINFSFFFNLLRVLVFLVKSDFTNFLDVVADFMKKLFSYILLILTLGDPTCQQHQQKSS